MAVIPPFQMARTQKNKATAHHLGLLKARLAKLRRELITPKGGGGGGPGEGLCFSSKKFLWCNFCQNNIGVWFKSNFKISVIVVDLYFLILNS